MTPSLSEAPWFGLFSPGCVYKINDLLTHFYTESSKEDVIGQVSGHTNCS